MSENENREVREENHPSEQDHKSVGKRLQIERIRMGLTPEDIANKLKLSLRQIDALEEDRYHELPGGIFIRGFVKSYAHMVGLDSAPLLADLKALTIHETPGKLPDLYAAQEPIQKDYRARQARGQRWLLVIVILLAIFAVGAAIMRYLGLQEVSFESEASSVTSYAPPMLQEEIMPDASMVDMRETDKVSLNEFASNVIAAPQPTLGIVVASNVASNTLAANTLQIRTTEDSWLRVVDANDETLLEGFIKANTIKNLGGSAPYQVRIGNVAHTSLIYDGKKIDLTPFAEANVATVEIGQGN